MSKELIDRLKSYIPSGDGHNSQYANDLADAVAILEAKAAPVGEREAFEAWFFCPSNSLLAEWEDAAREAFQVGAAYQRAQQPQSAEAVGEVKLQHMAIAEDGCLRWMTGRKIDNCYLYAMPDFGRAPKLYTTPQPSAGVVMPDWLDSYSAMAERLLKAGWKDSGDAQWAGIAEMHNEFARLNDKEVGRG